MVKTCHKRISNIKQSSSTKNMAANQQKEASTFVNKSDENSTTEVKNVNGSARIVRQCADGAHGDQAEVGQGDSKVE